MNRSERRPAPLLIRATGSRRRKTCFGRFITKSISSLTTSLWKSGAWHHFSTGTGDLMMFNESSFQRFIKKNPHHHLPFYARPSGSRRDFLRALGAGLASLPLQAQVVKSQSVQTKNTAKNVIFILLAGAPSHVDTFDLKMTNGITPSTFNPSDLNGVAWN